MNQGTLPTQGPYGLVTKGNRESGCGKRLSDIITKHKGCYGPQ